MSKLSHPCQCSVVFWSEPTRAVRFFVVRTRSTSCSTANKPTGSSALCLLLVRPAAARARITTSAKTNGSISSKVGFTLFLNGNWTDLSPGDCASSPRRSIHGFKNNTDQPIRVFVNFTPAGFEGMFAEAAEVWAQPEPDMSRLAALDEKYRSYPVEL